MGISPSRPYTKNGRLCCDIMVTQLEEYLTVVALAGKDVLAKWDWKLPKKVKLVQSLPKAAPQHVVVSSESTHTTITFSVDKACVALGTCDFYTK